MSHNSIKEYENKIRELKERIAKLEETLRLELERKDRIIRELEAKNRLLFLTALKQSAKNQRINEMLEQFRKKINVVNKKTKDKHKIE